MQQQMRPNSERKQWLADCRIIDKRNYSHRYLHTHETSDQSLRTPEKLSLHLPQSSTACKGYQILALLLSQSFVDLRGLARTEISSVPGSNENWRLNRICMLLDSSKVFHQSDGLIHRDTRLDVALSPARLPCIPALLEFSCSSGISLPEFSKRDTICLNVEGISNRFS